MRILERKNFPQARNNKAKVQIWGLDWPSHSPVQTAECKTATSTNRNIGVLSERCPTLECLTGSWQNRNGHDPIRKVKGTLC